MLQGHGPVSPPAALRDDDRRRRHRRHQRDSQVQAARRDDEPVAHHGGRADDRVRVARRRRARVGEEGRRRRRHQGRHRPARDRPPQRRVRAAHPRDRVGPRVDRGRRAALVRHAADHREGAHPHQAVRGRGHVARARPHQDRLHVGGHPRGRGPRARGHPLQPHAALRPAPGDRVRRGGRHAHLAVRGPDPRLVQEVDRQDVRSRRGPGRALGHDASTTTSSASATRPRSWARASATSARSPSSRAATCSRSRRTSSTSCRRRADALPRKLDPEKAQGDDDRAHRRSTRPRSARCTRPTRWRRDKLEEGIQGFTKAIVALEKLLGDRLA